MTASLQRMIRDPRTGWVHMSQKATALTRTLDSHVERHNLCHEDSSLIESATPLGISWRQRRRCRSHNA
jgi:hypothetical protein